ncbi:LacI family DNA-binding transcriptional regulator [Clostridium sp. Marseille-P2415]|uniref:LacI family DNA-binding transcriptional regulator n=1 Tax=Clostridium sp. Marseille-P2415 TaxID=1805471 RepID=UPI000988678A|nr:LacI family DNA-binding transcriptional regulator [Clostridium sp. Marseille-P2415]
MTVSIYDVAKRAGVSISTVSRILNQSANVSEKKIQAVKEAMEFYQYEPNQFGRGLVKQRSNIIGVYFPYYSGSVFESSYNLELLKGIEKILTRQNYSMVLISESEEYLNRVKGMPRFLEYIRQRRIDGLLLSGLTGKSIEEEAFRQILDEEYPVVYIGKRFHKNGINVYAQYESYMYQMLEILYQNGHRKILLYLYYSHQNYLNPIVKRAEEKMPDMDLVAAILPDMTEIRQILTVDIRKYVLGAGYTAVCSPGTETTRVLLSVCGELRVSVPETVSILSAEHKNGDGRQLFPQISAFYVPAKDMGSGAAQLLLDAIENRSSGEISREYETKYINRESIRRLL